MKGSKKMTVLGVEGIEDGDEDWREVESGRWKVWGREMDPENPRKEVDW